MKLKTLGAARPTRKGRSVAPASSGKATLRSSRAKRALISMPDMNMSRIRPNSLAMARSFPSSGKAAKAHL